MFVTHNFIPHHHHEYSEAAHSHGHQDDAHHHDHEEVPDNEQQDSAHDAPFEMAGHNADFGKSVIKPQDDNAFTVIPDQLSFAVPALFTFAVSPAHSPPLSVPHLHTSVLSLTFQTAQSFRGPPAVSFQA
jgi:hypothetical protein